MSAFSHPSKPSYAASATRESADTRIGRVTCEQREQRQFQAAATHEPLSQLSGWVPHRIPMKTLFIFPVLQISIKSLPPLLRFIPMPGSRWGC
ncbi:hypothetical protein M404DRAFT_772513 [Pisolithus tinctorius Marx 270]|uniref:Uncharacterized protein n=1 Tax=Pisolithus tinctorius Marx 270 TaxID=870435 RepID=A0A0C3NG59_PISTI|nr:hypothetical protein M404DRAFT_772513 [Pisolithus tinctorius Marx 270]